MSSLVSIVIPAYNAERWIGTALESALNQTWHPTEVIVIDDGSRDSTLAVARKYPVKVIRQENRGPAAARNRGLLEVRGDFIQYLDADDLLSPDKIEAQVCLLQSNPPGCIATSASFYFWDGEQPDLGVEERSGSEDSDNPVQWLIELWGPDGPSGMVPYGAWLTPRFIAERAGPWDESVRSPDDDGEYFARVVLQSSGIRRSNSGSYYYRKFRRGGSYSSTVNEELLRGRLHSADCKTNGLLARTDDIRAKRALANRYMDLAFGAYPSFPKLTSEALRRVQQLGGTDYVPSFATWRGQWLSHMLGWRVTKQLNTWYHR